MTRSRKEDNVCLCICSIPLLTKALRKTISFVTISKYWYLTQMRVAYDENQKLHYLLIVAIHRARAFIYNAPVSLVFGIYRHSSWLTFHLHDKAAWRCCNTAICIVSFYVWVQTRSTRARCLPIIVTALLHLFPLAPPAPAFRCSRVQICMCARATRVCFGLKRTCTSRWIVLENYPRLNIEPDETNFPSREMRTSF